jgi:hypothetical protein
MQNSVTADWRAPAITIKQARVWGRSLPALPVAKQLGLAPTDAVSTRSYLCCHAVRLYPVPPIAARVGCASLLCAMNIPSQIMP